MDQTCPVVHKSRRPQARLKDSHTVLHTLCAILCSNIQGLHSVLLWTPMHMILPLKV
jgi:hypothetical protein